jgi:hypothetical protein
MEHSVHKPIKGTPKWTCGTLVDQRVFHYSCSLFMQGTDRITPPHPTLRHELPFKSHHFGLVQEIEFPLKALLVCNLNASSSTLNSVVVFCKGRKWGGGAPAWRNCSPQKRVK